MSALLHLSLLGSAATLRQWMPQLGCRVGGRLSAISIPTSCTWIDPREVKCQPLTYDSQSRTCKEDCTPSLTCTSMNPNDIACRGHTHRLQWRCSQLCQQGIDPRLHIRDPLEQAVQEKGIILGPR